MADKNDAEIIDTEREDSLFDDMPAGLNMADLSIRDQAIRTFMVKKGIDLELLGNLRSPAMFNYIQQEAILSEGFGSKYAEISKDRLLRLTVSYQARNRDDIRTICTSDGSMGGDVTDAPGDSAQVIGSMARQGNYDAGE